MTIFLRIPSQQREPPPNLELRLRNVQSWLESLPMARTLAASEEVLLNLGLMNRSKVPSATRLPLLEAYRPVIEVLLDELEADLTLGSFPHPKSADDALRVHRALTTELGHGYKILITELAGRLLSFGLRRQLPSLAFRALAAEARQLRAAWLDYAAPPDGTWQEMHRLYAISEQTEVAATPVEGGQAIQDIYVESLLASLADPYHLPANEFALIPALLQRHRGAAAVLAQVPATPGPMHFLVNLDRDERPMHLSLGEIGTGQSRVLDTTALVSRLRAHHRALMAGQLPPGLSPHAVDQQISLLEKLIVLWGESPGRLDAREPAALSAAVRVGIDEIRSSLNATAPIAAPGWRVADRSLSGLQLEFSGSALPRKVGVGEALAVRLGPERSKPVGVVRWIKRAGTGSWRCGLQLLAPSASPVSLLSANAKGEPTQSLALLLERESALAPPTLLAPRGTHADSREFALCHPGETQRVRAGTLLEQSHTVEIFEATAT